MARGWHFLRWYSLSGLVAIGVFWAVIIALSGRMHPRNTILQLSILIGLAWLASVWAYAPTAFAARRYGLSRFFCFLAAIPLAVVPLALALLPFAVKGEPFVWNRPQVLEAIPWLFSFWVGGALFFYKTVPHRY